MLFANGAKLMMTGDSITDCDRARPIGETIHEGLGTGYVSLVDALIHAGNPGTNVRVMNTGISGNNSRDLLERWQQDVLDCGPDWISVMIGINDVWRQFDSPLTPERHVQPGEYEANLRSMLESGLAAAKGMILATPYYIEPNRADALRARMDEYGAIVKALAAEYGQPCVDTQAAFDSYLAGGSHSCYLAWDRVHPGRTGHMILANAFMQVVG